MLEIIIPLVITAVVLGVVWRDRRHVATGFEQACRYVGLPYDGRTGTAHDQGIRFDIDPDVNAGLFPRLRAQRGTVPATIRATLPVILPVRITPEGRGAFTGLLRGLDIQLGDLGFDAAARLEGDETDLRAVLDADVRAALAPLLALGGQFDGRAVTLHCWLGGGHGVEALRIVREAALALRSIAGSGRLGALARVAGHDPVELVRLRALSCLVTAWPRSRWTRTAARGGLTDPSWSLRRLAALYLGDRSTLLRLLEACRVPADAARLLDRLLGTPGGAEALRQRLDAIDQAIRPMAAERLRSAGVCLSGGVSLTGAEPGRLALVDSRRRSPRRLPCVVDLDPARASV